MPVSLHTNQWITDLWWGDSVLVCMVKTQQVDNFIIVERYFNEYMHEKRG